VRPEHHLKQGYSLIVVGFGSAEEHATVVSSARDALPAALGIHHPDAVSRPQSDVR
jgi:hypothetical protein